MIEPTLVPRIVALSFALFVIGAFGVLWRRNLLVSLMSLQLMFAAGQLAFVGSAGAAPAQQAAGGQVFALVALAIGAAQVVVGLATVAALVRHRDSVDVDDARSMRW